MNTLTAAPASPPVERADRGLAETEPTVLARDTDRGLTYTWFDRSPEAADAAPRKKAIETSLLAVTRGEQRVGYLRISFTTPDLAADRFPRPLVFAEKIHGWGLGYNHPPTGQQGPTPQQLWLTAHLYSRVCPVSLAEQGRRVAPYALDADLVPDEATIAADLAVLEKPLATEMSRWVSWYEVPFVAYARVDDELRGTGIGTRMYLLAADMLATTGRVLSASGIQTEDARRLWNRLVWHPDARVTRITKVNPATGQPSRHYALDHR